MGVALVDPDLAKRMAISDTVINNAQKTGRVAGTWRNARRSGTGSTVLCSTHPRGATFLETSRQAPLSALQRAMSSTVCSLSPAPPRLQSASIVR